MDALERHGHFERGSDGKNYYVGQISKAATDLGASRRTLQNRMREYGLPIGKSGRRKEELPYKRLSKGTRQTLGALGVAAAVGAGILAFKHRRKG